MGGTLGVAGSSHTRTKLISSHELKTFRRKKRRAADLFDLMGKPSGGSGSQAMAAVAADLRPPEIRITAPPWGEDDAYDDALAGQDQAWVTLATNDTYALGALVLAASLRKAGTCRQLAVLVTSEVSPSMRDLLGQSFNHVREVDPFNSNDAAHLAILRRPELGVTFTKIHCWTLGQYTKCVFLDADTLVLQNCDELFQREELSAVPDVGWPDCFNSGVFVFVPSMKTFEELIGLADREGSYDGGDQGLLNSYFSDWAFKDIARHLSFIYNMNSNAFYSYLPAFLKFGHNVKIVHFLGPRKPWHYHYNLYTNTVECDSVHYSAHLQFWWELFMSHVQPRLSTECAGLAGEMSRLSIKSGEELRSYPPDQILGSEGRQFAWERGQIDYLGADAFANIQKKLDATIAQGATAALTPGITAVLPAAQPGAAAVAPTAPPVMPQPDVPAVTGLPAPAIPSTPRAPGPGVPVIAQQLPGAAIPPSVAPVAPAAVALPRPPTAAASQQAAPPVAAAEQTRAKQHAQQKKQPPKA